MRIAVSMGASPTRQPLQPEADEAEKWAKVSRAANIKAE
jgi:hypothetical protein